MGIVEVAAPVDPEEEQVLLHLCLRNQLSKPLRMSQKRIPKLTRNQNPRLVSLNPTHPANILSLFLQGCMQDWKATPLPTPKWFPTKTFNILLNYHESP